MINLKDYFGNGHFVEFLGEVTGKEFHQKYNVMALSEDKLPVASNILSLTDANGCTLRTRRVSSDVDEPLYEAWIFYETKPEPDNRQLSPQTGKVETPAPKKQLIM